MNTAINIMISALVVLLVVLTAFVSFTMISNIPVRTTGDQIKFDELIYVTTTIYGDLYRMPNGDLFTYPKEQYDY